MIFYPAWICSDISPPFALAGQSRLPTVPCLPSAAFRSSGFFSVFFISAFLSVPPLHALSVAISASLDSDFSGSVPDIYHSLVLPLLSHPAFPCPSEMNTCLLSLYHYHTTRHFALEDPFLLVIFLPLRISFSIPRSFLCWRTPYF